MLDGGRLLVTLLNLFLLKEAQAFQKMHLDSDYIPPVLSAHLLLGHVCIQALIKIEQNIAGLWHSLETSLQMGINPTGTVKQTGLIFKEEGKLIPRKIIHSWFLSAIIRQHCLATKRVI